MRVPPKRKVNVKLLARQAYETLAIIAAVLPYNHNTFGAAQNCCTIDFRPCPRWQELKAPKGRFDGSAAGSGTVCLS